MCDVNAYTCINNLFMDHRALHSCISILFTDHKSSLRLCAAAIHDISHFLFSKICFFLALYLCTHIVCIHLVELKWNTFFSFVFLSCRCFYRLFTLLVLHLVRYRTNKIISVHFFPSSFHFISFTCAYVFVLMMKFTPRNGNIYGDENSKRPQNKHGISSSMLK